MRWLFANCNSAVLLLCLSPIAFCDEPTSNSTSAEAAQSSSVPNELQSSGAPPFPGVQSSLGVDRWAIIIGISKYKYGSSGIENLKYADRDAESLYDLIQKPSMGGFSKDHIKKLTNEDATTANITRALHTFLKRPAAEDVVLLYFSSHGVVDSDRPDVVFLATYDTDPEDISGSALPMREIELSLQEFLLARRVVILADTCHSGAIGGAGRKTVAPLAGKKSQDYLTQVAKSREGMALLTSSQQNEVSMEDAKWGGGHGVFTHFLLQGVRGDADAPDKSGKQDGVVTVSELFEYVREQVKLATDNMQHPTIGPKSFDPDFPMAITGGITARKHFELGTGLYEAGHRLEEKRLLRSAAKHLSEAQHFFHVENSSVDEMKASRLRGLAEITAGNFAGAIKSLETARQLDTEKQAPDIIYHLGMAYAKQKDYRTATQRLQEFITNSPQDESVDWAKSVVDWLKLAQQGDFNRFALLIGADEVASRPECHLHAPQNDVRRIKTMLMSSFNLPEAKIVTLVGNNATYRNVVKELDRYAHELQQNDSLIVYFSGHGADVAPLILYDSKLPSKSQRAENVISPTELNQLASEIPGATWLLLDANPSASFFEIAKQQMAYSVFFAGTPGQPVFEIKTDNGPFGNFTYAFTDCLANPQALLSDNDLLTAIHPRTLHARHQTPVFVGDGARHFFF